jgi:hypothetical protein
MSISDDRAEIATAASTVAGVTVSPRFRQVTKAGQGFIKLDRIEYPDRIARANGGIAYYVLWVILPADVAAAEERAEELEPLLRNAIGRAWAIDSAQLADLQVDTGTLPVLQLTGHREISTP